MSIDIIVFSFSMLLPDLVIRYLCGLAFGLFPILCDITIILLIDFILILIKKNIKHIIEIIIIFINSFYCFAQVVHFGFFKTFYSLKKLTVASELIDVMVEVKEKLHLNQLLFVVPVVLVILSIILDNKKEIKLKKKISIILIGLSLIFSSLLVVFKIRSNIDDWYGDYYLYTNFQSKNLFMTRFGNIHYLGRDLYSIVNSNNGVELSKEDKDQLDNFVLNNNTILNNDMSCLFEGKNLIMILCESLNDYPIKEDLTPTLYKLVTDGMYFNNYYAPLYLSATGDSEFISQTGLLPSIDYGTTSYTFQDNDYSYSLANLFNNVGYKSNSYHSNKGNFYNRELLHSSLGFNSFYDIDKLDIVADHYMEDYINWTDDKILFEKTIENTDTSKPFFDFIITASGHLPYSSAREELIENYQIVNSIYPDLAEQTKYYLASQMKLDEGLETLINKLDEEGILEDTIIVIFGDHYPYGIEDSKAYEEVIGYDIEYKQYQVPFVIYNPCASYENNYVLGSTFDIYPTICNLFGLKTNSYMVGHDLFNANEDRKVVFMDHSVVTNDFYYNVETSKLVELSDNYTIENFNNVMADVNDVFKYGQKILITNYYRD